MQPRIASLRSEPIAFAHRGGMAHASENTIEAFVLGLRLGANGLETDAWTTADGHVVLDHDGIVKKIGRKRQISSMLLTQLPDHIPTLSDLFATCGTSFDLSIDIKDTEGFVGAAMVARDHGFDPSRLWLCHPSLQLLSEQRKLVPGVRLVDSTRLTRVKEGLEMRCAALSNFGIDALNMHHTDWTGGSVTLVHKFGLHAFGWDTQFEIAIENALRMGLDGVFSDHVDTMVDVYSQQLGYTPRHT
jgi:glycerophosphoryl diester phosphodiesterase